ncbi:MAG: ROK family protein [Candidatus Riflebacteria bacterium]|nr:ROK family protein [Candidatus Riflebacteria bacterium]
MMVALFDADFKILASHREKLKSRSGPKTGIEQLTEAISQTLADAAVKPEQLAGIGLGCPGQVDLDKGVIIEAPNLGWRDVPLKQLLEKIFNCPVVITNDVDAGTYGEYIFGAGKGGRCVLGVFPGTGIGGACVYDGHLIRGKSGSCLEIGHIQVQSDGPLCGCGRRGCIEAIASRLAISAQIAMAAFRGSAPHLLEEAGLDLREIRSKTIVRSIEAGDAVVEKIVRDAARKLGNAIASVVNLLAPDIVVLGGGLVEALPKLYQKEVGDAIKSEAMKAFTAELRIEVAKLGDNAGVLGAAALIV